MQPPSFVAPHLLRSSDDVLVFVIASDPLARAQLCCELLSDKVSAVAFDGIRDLMQRWLNDETGDVLMSPDVLVVYGPDLDADRHAMLETLCELTGLIPVIYLDQFADVAARQAAFQAGCSALVPLPHLKRELADAVRMTFVPRTVPVKTPRVLLADPDPVLRDLIAFYLREQGWSVVEVADGEAAVAQLALHRFDILVLETALPFVSGLALLQCLRAHRLTCTARVMFLSARSGSDIQKLAFESGADDFVAKPFDPEVLLARLNRLELSPRPVRLELSDAQRARLRAALPVVMAAAA